MTCKRRKRNGRGGGGGCSELGREIHYERRASGKERFIRRDNNEMNVVVDADAAAGCLESSLD